MNFLKLEDVKKAIENGTSIEELKVYKANYQPHMPIKIRDYGYSESEPLEYECGSDQSHHWLRITRNGELRFQHIQCMAVSITEEQAKEFGECCFVPTFVCGDGEMYITPSKLLVIQNGDD